MFLRVFLVKCQDILSSANSGEYYKFFELVNGISLMNTRKVKGPKTEPCGAPHEIGFSTISVLHFTWKLLNPKKFIIKLITYAYTSR